MLATQHRGRRTPRGGNDLALIAQTILRTTGRDAFCVVEVAAGKAPGMVGRKANLLRPNIAVVTTIGTDHYRLFRTRDATAVEKRALLAGAAEGATAVLNADDPRALGMAAGFDGPVITFGSSPGATLRALDVRASWPERLPVHPELARVDMAGAHAALRRALDRRRAGCAVGRYGGGSPTGVSDRCPCPVRAPTGADETGRAPWRDVHR